MEYTETLLARIKELEGTFKQQQGQIEGLGKMLIVYNFVFREVVHELR